MGSDGRAPKSVATRREIAPERLSKVWTRPVDKKSLQIRMLEHFPVAQFAWIQAEYALDDRRETSRNQNIA
jgi:hypothetical protein